MSARIIDGKTIAADLRGRIADAVHRLRRDRGIVPGIAVILVGDNPASEVYVRNKVKACRDNGIHSSYDRYPATLSEAALLERIDALNRDPSIHGILVQLPLPPHIDSHKVIEVPQVPCA